MPRSKSNSTRPWRLPSQAMNRRDGNAYIPTYEQVSAGGVVYRGAGTSVEIAIVQVVSEMRWQLPKGIIDEGETNE
jgi:8-oxo-dGTP diphosphatase